MSLLRLHRLEKHFPGGVAALRQVDLEVGPGELLAVIGPSGSGKSTLLRLVAGLERPTAGIIEIEGRDVASVSPNHREVAMVFQDYALYPHLDVRQNLTFGLKAQRLTRAEIENRIDEVAGWLQIAPLLTRRPAELSGGERQRVAVGRALVRRPKVFLLDEPLANLDLQLRDQARRQLKDLQQRLGTTTLYVTHDQHEAMALGDRVAVLHQGGIEQVGTPEEIYLEPVNRLVASFIGRPAMNFMAGEAKEGKFVTNNTEVQIPLDPSIGDQPVELGVRPEDIVIAGQGYPLGTAVVQRIERLGGDTLVHLELGKLSWVARVASSRSMASNGPIPLSARVGSVHLFRAGPRGERLCRL